jgi:uncharacterized protein
MVFVKVSSQQMPPKPAASSGAVIGVLSSACCHRRVVARASLAPPGAQVCKTAVVTGTEVPEAFPPDHFDEYELVFLWSPEDRQQLDEEAADRLQRQHLGHLESMRAAGHMLVAGPLFAQPDRRLRGICIYRTGDVDRARELASADPAVKAGQLEIEVMGWLTRPGALRLNG